MNKFLLIKLILLPLIFFNEVVFAGYSYHGGVCVGGRDLRILNGASRSSCQSACTSRSDCLAYDFAPKRVGTSEPSCYLEGGGWNLKPYSSSVHEGLFKCYHKDGRLVRGDYCDGHYGSGSRYPCSSREPICGTGSSANECNVCNGNYGTSNSHSCYDVAFPICENIGTTNAKCVKPTCDGNYGSGSQFPCQSSSEPICENIGQNNTFCRPECDGDYQSGTQYPCGSSKPICEGVGTENAKCITPECDGNYQSGSINPCKTAKDPICLNPGKTDAKCTPKCDGDYQSGSQYPCDPIFPKCKDAGQASALCVECLRNPDCKNFNEPICGTNDNCGPCNGDYNEGKTHDCPVSSLPKCKDAGQPNATCVECLLDSHCSSTEICDNNKCIPAASVTVQVTLNPSTITTNDKGKLIITITNPNTVPIVLDENFDTTVPSDVNISNISGSCGAVIVGNIIRLNKGANINANGSCTITADLGSDNLGRYDVVTGNITTNIGNVINPADKVLIVQCFTNNDCPSSEPICGTDNTCDDCNGNMNSGRSHECFENDKKYCKNPGQNNAVCVECLSDSNCSGGQICVANQCVDPVCDSDYGSSKPFACKDPINKICDNPSTVNAKCRPVCDGDYGGTTNYPCKTRDNPVCVDIGKATAECVECNVDSDCKENEVCYFNQCVEVGNGSCTSFYRNFPDRRATQITDNCGISGAHPSEVNYNFNLLCNDNKKAVCILCRKHMQWTLQEKSKSSYSKDDDSGVCEIVRCIYDKFDPGANYKCNTRKIVSEPYTIDQVNKFSICGNNKKEGPEECDGGSNCDANCQLK